MAGGLINLVRRADKYALYVLACLLAAYLLNQLDRYALAVTSMPMAQDIHFGDKGCVNSKNVSFSGQTKLCNKEPGSTEVEKNSTRWANVGVLQCSLKWWNVDACRGNKLFLAVLFIRHYKQYVWLFPNHNDLMSVNLIIKSEQIDAKILPL